MSQPLPYIDTHCHINSILQKLSLNSFSELKAQYPSNFETAISISCDPHSIDFTLNLIQQHSVYGAFGIHPNEAQDYTPQVELKILEAIKHPKTVAWGEIGLDFHYQHSSVSTQTKVFEQQIKLALKYYKPLIIHTRDAEEPTFQLLQTLVPTHWNIHIHCFTGSNSFAQKLLHHFSNLYLGFTGIITFKKTEELQKVVLNTPLNRILLETDGPYLAPVPHRGKPCHSGYIPLIAQKIATLKNISISTVYQQIRQNTQAMYHI